MTMALRIKPIHRDRLQDAVESAKEAYNALVDDFNSEIGADNTELRDLDGIVESEYFNDRDEREYEYLCSRRVA